MLQKAWSCSRIPKACIVILPVGFVIRHFIFLIPNTSNTIRSAGLRGPKWWDSLFCNVDISHSKLVAVSVAQYMEQYL